MNAFRTPSRAAHLSRMTSCLVMSLLTWMNLSANAKNPIRTAFFQNYPGAVGSVLDTVPSHPTHCGVCHYDFSGGGTRNPFGAAVEANLNQGNSNAVWLARLLDSDGDGFLNIVEVTNTFTYGNTP